MKGVGVCFIQDRQIVGIALRDILGKIRLESQCAVIAGLGHAEERHPGGSQPAKVDGVSAARSAHGDRDVLSARHSCLEVPFAEHAEPPAIVTRTIGPRGTLVRADR